MRNTIITQLCILCIAAIGCEIDDPYGPIEDRDADLLDESPDSPGDEPGLEADIKPFATTYQPDTVQGPHLKCCNGSVNCIPTTGSYPGTCSGGKVLTACYGCDFEGNDGVCSGAFDSGMWTFMSPPNLYFCNGFSWAYNTGIMADDRCSQDGCVPGTDVGVCNYQDVGGNDYPNGCPDYGAMETWMFDGAIGRMCCHADANSPSGYYCIPMEKSDSCSDSPHTTTSYCMPCENAPNFYDPDGSGSNNTNGGWDLKGTGTNEFPGSIYCGNGSDDTIHEAGLPDWTGDECKKVEYVCRGVQVNAGTGAIQNSEC